jgi:hypothetical protein
MLWKDPDARPQPVMLETLYDWDSYYAPHMNFVSGVMSSKHCSMYVRAIRLSVGRSGFVEMVYKGSPSDPMWTTTDNDHYPNADGLVILRS